MKWTLLPSMTRATRCSLLVASTFLGACASFDDPTTIKDLRLLTVRAEPSELVISDPETPPPVIKLWPLLVDPSGVVSDATFSIVGCPNRPFGPSPPSDPMATGGFPAGGARGTLSSTLCPSDPQAPNVWPLGSSADTQADGSVAVTLSADQIKAALMSDVFPDQFGHPHGGFDLGLPITFDFQVTRGQESVRGVKRVLFWFPPLVPAIEGEVPNVTPEITTIQQAKSRDDDAVLQELAPFDAATADALDRPVVAPGGTLWIVPNLADQEPYITTVLDRVTGEVTRYPVDKETLRYSYFATLGKFSPGSVSTDLSRGAKWKDGQPHLESKYEAPPLGELPVDPDSGKHAADVTIWIVVRDDRGGTSWQERHLLVSEP